MPEPRLPDAPALPPLTGLTRPAPGFACPPRLMLLVEDSRVAAEAVRLICRRIGIRLRRAESLAHAAMHLRVYRPDIVLVDPGLPDGSGLDLIARLASARMRPSRLVGVSGDAAMEGPVMAAGADAFLLKPVSVAQHLAAMTGELAPRLAAQDGGEEDGLPTRNAGADPLALRDDLRRVRDLLAEGADPARLRYAGQFLASVAQALPDRGLAHAALSASRDGDSARIRARVTRTEGESAAF
ncbi:response regulator [Pararhodobacter marinus]|uniref:response regulator n=1 Tax=Pararhodobacter marinus TaxID=2184063 RepID=UPI0035141D25